MAEAQLIKAIYRDGILQLLEPVDLPEGAEVRVQLEAIPRTGIPEGSPTEAKATSYPTRPQPFSRLDPLVGIVAIGGDALADSEALYDEDWG